MNKEVLLLIACFQIVKLLLISEIDDSSNIKCYPFAP